MVEYKRVEVAKALPIGTNWIGKVQIGEGEHTVNIEEYFAGKYSLYVTAVDQAGNPLKSMDVAARAGYQIITDGMNYMPTADANTRALWVKITDGTHDADVTEDNELKTYDPKVYAQVETNTHVEIYTRLGAPAGASLAADIAAIKAVVDDILTDTGTTLPATLSTIDGNVDEILPRATLISPDYNYSPYFEYFEGGINTNRWVNGSSGTGSAGITLGAMCVLQSGATAGGVGNIQGQYALPRRDMLFHSSSPITEVSMEWQTRFIGTPANVDESTTFAGWAINAADNRANNTIAGLIVDSEAIKFLTDSGGSEEITDLSSHISFGSTYYFIKLVCDGSSYKLYINGTLRATHSTRVPNLHFRPVFWMENDANANVQMVVGMLRMWYN